MTGALVLLLLILFGALISVLEARRAPVGYICPTCKGEVIGREGCPWCGRGRRS